MAVKLNSKDYIWSYIGVFMAVGASVIILPFIRFWVQYHLCTEYQLLLVRSF